MCGAGCRVGEATREFWPIVVISVFLTGVYGALTEVLLLVGFGLIAFAAAVTALRARPPRIVEILRETLESSGQAAVRLSILSLGALVVLSSRAGFDSVLGAFAAGLIVGLVFDKPEGKLVRTRLEGIGFGFLIPIYFVTAGVTFDLDSLLTARGIALTALFLALLLVSRGPSALLWRDELDHHELTALALFGATGLPLIVAIVGIGTDHGAIAPSVGASLIGAGMVSVLVYPLLAIRTAGKQALGAGAQSAVLEDAVEV